MRCPRLTGGTDRESSEQAHEGYSRGARRSDTPQYREVADSIQKAINCVQGIHDRAPNFAYSDYRVHRRLHQQGKSLSDPGVCVVYRCDLIFIHGPILRRSSTSNPPVHVARLPWGCSIFFRLQRRSERPKWPGCPRLFSIAAIPRRGRPWPRRFRISVSAACSAGPVAPCLARVYSSSDVVPICAQDSRDR